MNNIKSSIINSISDEEFINLTNKVNSIADIIRYFNLNIAGSNYRTVKNKMLNLGINVDNFIKKSLEYNKIRAKNRINNINELLVENSNLGSCDLRRRLIRQGLLSEECSICKLGNIWKGQSITLELDHINGNNTDNRLENLRILCPNCHSQTETYSGKKLKNLSIKFCHCGIRIHKTSSNCIDCAAKLRGRLKSNIPLKEILEIQIWEMPATKLAKLYGVSDVTISKWCRKYNIEKPNIGYWIKKN